MAYIDQLNEGIKEAMRSRDSLRLNTLRMLKSKILAVDARGQLPDAEVVKLFKTYLGNLEEALEQSSSRPEMVEQLRKEIEIVQEFLPKALSREETEKVVKQAIAESGATTKKEMGLVMKKIRELNSSIEGKLAKELVDQLLGE